LPAGLCCCELGSSTGRDPRCGSKIMIERKERTRMRTKQTRKTGTGAFTLIELLVVIAIIAILASMLLPALSRAKESGKRIGSVNNIRQLGLSMQMYTDDNEGFQPMRTINGAGGSWPTVLSEYYSELKILACPSDLNPQSFSGANSNQDRAPRSYILNGWNDYFEAQGIAFTDLEGKRMPETAIREPSETIMFGEKLPESHHYYMDFMEVTPDDLTSNDFSEVDHGKHMKGPGGSGGSNFAFADGSARYLKHWGSIQPINLWGVTPKWRTGEL
jgi:prepilin-type N-terminal cleavage/methylation domain-containing protein/prepilin-type processing-associated H-X9-DG protein